MRRLRSKIAPGQLGFLSLLYEGGRLASESGDLTIAGLRFSEDALDIEISAPQLAVFEAYQHALEKRGVAVAVIAVDAGQEGLRAQLRLRKGPA